MAQVIPETWAVPERFRQRIGAKAGRQRAMVDGGHLLLILHELPKVGETERDARLFWRAPTGEWRATGAKGNGLAALKQHLETFHEALQELDEQVDRAKTAMELFHILRAAGPIARAAKNKHRALQEAREGVDDKEIISLRDLAGDVDRAGELVVADATNALEYLETKAAEEQTVFAQKATDAQHRLNMIAALFFPVTAVGSILGTNLHSGLEGQGAWLFWSIVAGAFSLGFIVRGSVTKTK